MIGKIVINILGNMSSILYYETLKTAIASYVMKLRKYHDILKRYKQTLLS